MLKMIPPVYAYISFKALIKSFFSCDWEKEWSKYLDARETYGFCSARVAICKLLSSIKSTSERMEVIIPAYTCPSVILSIKQAGLHPVMCDMRELHGEMDLSVFLSLANEKTLAVITTNLYSMPDPIDKIKEITSKKGIFLIEDLSLSLGQYYNGKKLGLFGDAACTSLGLSKVITVGNGGVLSVRNKNIELLAGFEKYTNNRKLSLKALTLILLYPIFLSKIVFFIISKTKYRLRDDDREEFQESRDCIWSLQQSRFSCTLLNNVCDPHNQRVKNGKILYEIVEKSKFLNLKTQQKVGYLRFPVLTSSRGERDDLVEYLRLSGIYATRGFATIASYLDSDKHPNAIILCERLLTIPCHHKMKKEDFVLIGNVIDSF